MTKFNGPYCDGETCTKIVLIGEQRFDGEHWFEYSCGICGYYFRKRVPVAQKTHLKPLEHQLQAARELDNGKVLWGGVGSGKSITALYYYMQKEAPRPIYVITTAKKRESLDWVVEASKFGIGTEEDATIAGVITVDSWQNIKKYTHIENAFFIFDEQRLVGTGAWYKAFIKITKNNRWILLSATPGDTWMDFIALFVANGFVKNITQFKQDHVVYNSFSKYPKVERYRRVGELVRWRNEILVHMPYQKHTKRHIKVIPVEHDADVIKQVLEKRWHVYENRPLSNIAEMFLVMRKVNNSHPSRLETVRCLMKEHPKLIIFYNFNFELESLRTLADTVSGSISGLVKDETPTSVSQKDATEKPVSKSHETSQGLKNSTESSFQPTSKSSDDFSHRNDSGQSGSNTSTITSNEETSFAVAEWNGHKHEPIPKTDRWIYLVQYTAGSEGWNCVETDAMVLFSLSYSYKATHQSMGRIDRLNTPYTDLYYYVLKSNSFIDSAVWKALQSKKSFNESSFAKAQGW